MDNYVVGTTAEEKALLKEKLNIKSGADLLNRVAVGTYCKEQDVIFVDSTDKAPAVMKTLMEKHIQSVPVRDVKRLKYNSFIDAMDVLVHILNTAEKAKKENLSAEATMESFASLTAAELANLSKKDPFSPIGVDTPTKIALDKFVRWKAHRLPVLGGDGQLEMVLSQMGVLEFLQEHATMFEVCKKTVGEVKLGYKPVCSVTENDTVQRAFSLMVDMGIAGLAVVDEKGAPIGGISVSDGKKVLVGGKLDLSILEMTVGEFKKKSYEEDKAVCFFFFFFFFLNLFIYFLFFINYCSSLIHFLTPLPPSSISISPKIDAWCHPCQARCHHRGSPLEVCCRQGSPFVCG